MENRTRNLLIGVFVLGLGITAFATRKYWMPKKSSKKKGMATSNQFDDFYKNINAIGSDMFEGSSAQKLADLKNKFLKNLTKEDADKLIDIAKTKEKDWSASQKINFPVLFKKWTGMGV